MSTATTTFRPIEEADLEFLYSVFATTRPDVDLVDWEDEQKEQFLRIQFEAQHVHYQKYFPDAQFDVILCDGQPVGRVYVDRNEEDIHIIDISVLTVPVVGEFLAIRDAVVIIVKECPDRLVLGKGHENTIVQGQHGTREDLSIDKDGSLVHDAIAVGIH